MPGALRGARRLLGVRVGPRAQLQDVHVVHRAEHELVRLEHVPEERGAALAGERVSGGHGETRSGERREASQSMSRTERLSDGSLLSFVSDTHGAYTAIRDPQGAVPLMVLTSARTGWDRTWIEDLLPRIAVRGLDASATAPDSMPAGGGAR